MKNIVSDKAEKTEAANSLKSGQKEQFANVNARGESIDECPLVPVGPSIFLEYNVKEESSLVLTKKDQQEAQKPLKNYFKVIGIGATVKTVNIGDLLILRSDANIETIHTEDFQIEGMVNYKYHTIFEHAVKQIVK
tara:strand:+ start:2329 stop:2736 length:408 start_codon:yes stop_codon:yes gene_type:complete